MKVMILAAGLGTRMRPLTDNCPKPLLKVAGKPLIQHHIERLAECGFRQIVINLAYRGEQIRRFLGTGSQWGVEISYSMEEPALETGGGVFNALPLLGPRGESFVVVNGDVWSDFDYSSLAELQNDLAHLVMVDNPTHNVEGDFSLGDGRIGDDKTGLRLTFSGISVLRGQLFEGEKAGAFSLVPLFRKAIAAKQVSGNHFKGKWVDVGTPERLQLLETYLDNP
ncbi:N-acetylmuramate alpha-1-phosphate uridylyltransferase MurU [Motiliproteus sp. MSK22-1]|uniref:N-acetylmuramate alpha-1-phosphate uridylyltransferase MurU n=1 Tax=Motiliproteus sp. MSK22-1 TaxID=1897630 RepID=UPI000976D7C0|nr:nucleotidyltransferase family protein [Motiliproteus sp. MSK22-1]OMH32161.1 mannose-1-phosphate guanylyltransferase [Motiliproteus sp. MSK22-1]